MRAKCWSNKFVSTCKSGILRLSKEQLVLTLAVVWASAAPAAITSFVFDYPDRASLLADGWSFIAHWDSAFYPFVTYRDTEMTNGAVVSYDQVEHPGIVRIPVDSGDLWSSYNNSRNTLFRTLPDNWISVRLAFAFWPTQDVQQASLMIYEDDDNYLSIAHAHSGGYERVAMVREFAGEPNILNTAPITTTNLFLRLDRDLGSDTVTGLYSLDGTNWVVLDHAWQTLENPQAGIFAGGSYGGFPNADLQELDIVTTDNPPPPVIRVDPTNLVFNATVGQPCTNSQQLRVMTRAQDPAVSWVASTGASWLTCSTTVSNTPGTTDVSVDTTGLTPGAYKAPLMITGGSGAVPTNAWVRLIINPATRASFTTWRGGKSGAMSVSVDDAQPTAFDDLSTNGFCGTYFINGTSVPAFFTSYLHAGMELGGHTVTHSCLSQNEATCDWDIANNIAAICTSTRVSRTNVMSFDWPCGAGASNIVEKTVAATYFLSARGYNINQLEDPSPYDFMNLKSFNSHEHAPGPPSDLKTVVDAAIAQGKWFNMVLHATNDDDGAIVYAVGKDIWVAPIGSVTKYILQRDRAIITNYWETPDTIGFEVCRLALSSSRNREFEAAIGPQDLLTMKVDLSGFPPLSGVLLEGSPLPFVTNSIGGTNFAIFDLAVTPSLQMVSLRTDFLLIIRECSLTNEQVTLTWTSLPGHLYRLQSRDTVESAWNDLAPDVPASSGSTTSGTDTNSLAQQRFYRVIQLP